MTDEPAAPVAPLAVLASDIVDLMSRVEHDVTGQCWTLWTELKALVEKAV